jgi:RND family efflux transporter MFP subunit
MHRDGAISEDKLDQAISQRDSLMASWEVAKQQEALAQAGAEVMRRHLENYEIRAPFSGVAVSKDAQIGEILSPASAGGGFTRTGISTIVDMASLEIEVDVNESYIARVHTGQSVIAVLDAYPQWEIPAKVRTVIPAADRQKATVKVRISFDALESRILPDMGVKVSFLPEKSAIDSISPESNPNTLLLPASALRSDGSNTQVCRVMPGNQLQWVPVQLGNRSGSLVEITQGLQPGTLVVADASQPFQSGQVIRPKR